MPDIEVTITNNADEVRKALPEAVEAALIAIGLMAESYAKKKLTENKSVDTGRLRNSITFALSGKQANIDEYTDIDKTQTWTYEGTAPGAEGENAVYIGTNVEYANFVESGTSKSTAKPYLRPACTEHNQEFKKEAEKAFKSFG